jgi:predicted Zn-dependent peptidase
MEYPITQISNKLKVVSHRLKGRESVALGVFMRVGGRFEPKRISGISHFIEHLIFKGTARRNAKKIKEEIEGRGGVLNGYTSEDTTCFLIKIIHDHLSLALDVLSDMVQHAAFKHADIEKERTVILEEIKMYMDMPMHYAHDLINQLLWQGQPLGMLISGDAESVSRITRDDLIAFHKKYYVPVNTFVAVCGDIEHAELVEETRHHFRSPAKQSASRFKKIKDQQQKARFLFHDKETEQSHIVFGFPSISRNDPKRYALALLHIILGANMSSRLYEQIREKRGLAYDIRSGVNLYDDVGSFTISAGVENRKVEKTVGLIMKELVKVKDRGVRGGELKRAKEYLYNQFYFALDDTLDHMLWLGDKAMHFARIPEKKDVRRMVDEVTVEDIQAMARKVFQTKTLNFVMIGTCETKRQAAIKRQCVV